VTHHNGIPDRRYHAGARPKCHLRENIRTYGLYDLNKEVVKYLVDRSFTRRLRSSAAVYAVFNIPGSPPRRGRVLLVVVNWNAATLPLASTAKQAYACSAGNTQRNRPVLTSRHAVRAERAGAGACFPARSSDKILTEAR
jgi:hypothetical protein